MGIKFPSIVTKIMEIIKNNTPIFGKKKDPPPSLYVALFLNREFFFAFVKLCELFLLNMFLSDLNTEKKTIYTFMIFLSLHTNFLLAGQAILFLTLYIIVLHICSIHNPNYYFHNRLFKNNIFHCRIFDIVKFNLNY